MKPDAQMNPHTRIKRSVSTGAVRGLFAMAIAMAALWTPGAIAQPAPHPAEPPAPPIPIEQMRAFGYTKAFAERFALPAPEPGWEPSGGLAAVEFRVEAIPGTRGLYDCAFNLYVEGALDIAFPEPGPSGSEELYTVALHSFLNYPKGASGLSDADRRAHWERRRGFAQLGAFATADYVPGKRGVVQSSSMHHFVREIFPGLHYVRLSSCEYPRWLARRETDVTVWVRRATARERTRTPVVDPSDFYQFTLPPAFVAKTLAWADWVAKHDSRVFDIEAGRTTSPGAR